MLSKQDIKELIIEAQEQGKMMASNLPLELAAKYKLYDFQAFLSLLQKYAEALRAKLRVFSNYDVSRLDELSTWILLTQNDNIESNDSYSFANGTTQKERIYFILWTKFSALYKLEYVNVLLNSELPQSFIDNGEEYNNIYAISPLQRRVYDQFSRSLTTKQVNDKRYFLRNENIYNSQNGELIQKASQVTYNTSFYLDIKDIANSEVISFLDTQLENSPNKEQLVNHIKYSISQDESLNKGKLLAIQDWLQEKTLVPLSLSANNSKLSFKRLSGVGWYCYFQGIEITMNNQDKVLQRLGIQISNRRKTLYNKYLQACNNEVHRNFVRSDLREVIQYLDKDSQEYAKALDLLDKANTR